MPFKRVYLFLLIALLPFLYLLQKPKIYQPFHQVTLTIAKPFLVAGDSVSYAITEIRETFSNFWATFKNQTERNRLQADLDQLRIKYSEVEKENKRLSELLHFKEQFPLVSVPARVIGWDLSFWRKTVLIDKGSADGIKPNMVVVSPAGVVGRILELTPVTARVLLLTDPDARVSAMAQDSRAQGVVSGNGTPHLNLRYLELDQDIKVGEVVITSGSSGLFPKGLAIGVIQSIGRDMDGLHLNASLLPFVDFSTLEEVLCLDYSQAK